MSQMTQQTYYNPNTGTYQTIDDAMNEAHNERARAFSAFIKAFSAFIKALWSRRASSQPALPLGHHASQ